MIELSEDIRDGFQEVANIAVGQTADKIARSFSTFVQLPIPQVHLLESVDIRMALSATNEDTDVSAVVQPFFGDRVSGEALLLFNDATHDDLSRLMGYESNPASGSAVEHMLEMASLLSGSCIHSILAQLEIEVMISYPVLLGVQTTLREMFTKQEFPWSRTLAIELNYRFEGYSASCDLVILFHQQSLAALTDKLELLLA